MSGSAPTPASRRTFASSDPMVAQEFVEEVYGGPRLRLLGARAKTWKVTLTEVEMGQITVCDLSVPGELTFEVNGGADVVIETVLDGAADITQGLTSSRYVPRDVFVGVRPDANLHSRTHGLRVHTVALPVDLLVDVARDNGEEPSGLEEMLGHAADPAAASRWRQVTRYLDWLLVDPDFALAPLVMGQAERLLAATALSFKPGADPARSTASDVRDAHPASLRRAINYIEAHPDRDITLADVADAAQVTTRTVQIAFRRHLNSTPMAYLRQTRLHYAHRQLVSATPEDGLTVRAVARGWGFANPSRFSELHRAAYGEAPSHTLERSAPARRG